MPRPTEWTEEEIGRLRRLYPSERSFDEIVEAFPNRTSNAIRVKASRLDLRRPTLPSSVCQSQTILLCSAGGGEYKGYLFRCSDCGSWIQVNDEEETDGGSIVVCGNCGSTRYLVA